MKGQLAVSTPEEYLASLAEPRRSEVAALHALIRKTAPKLEPFILKGILAYGPHRFKYASGREGDWFRIGVSSNASYISLYAGTAAQAYKKELPKANIGRACVRFKRLSDLDQKVLARLIKDCAKVDTKS
jgi:hypothetical protein